MTDSVINLVTDYLVVGAGAMGMSFLEELIKNSSDIEAIIIDTRSAPGGHWNDAYSFVRLHQPALTYGVNSRSLGSGGADLASKSLILEHCELALIDLVATGRVKFFPQCEYLEDGRFISLLDYTQYQVKINAKLVDATCTITHVPATKEPNFKFAENVNLIPINGLSKLSNPWQNYLIIGGGKTGIDAVLFLLDNNVSAEKISWVVPNDSWFLNRDSLRFDNGDLTQFLLNISDAIIDEKNRTPTEILLALEQMGVMMRLDRCILPTRYRAATINSAEVIKLQIVKNIIRKGRIEKIEPDEITFQSGEKMNIDPCTLCVDCSTNSTLFPPKKKVFDGNRINVQYIRMPPPSISASIIAALELKYPDDEEKKNGVCTVLTPPQMPEDFVANSYVDNKTIDATLTVLGFNWERQRRSSLMHHVPLFDLLKLVFYMWTKKKLLVKKFEMLLNINNLA